MCVVPPQQEAAGCDPLDELYDALAEVVGAEDTTECYKSYLLVPVNTLCPVPLQCLMNNPHPSQWRLGLCAGCSPVVMLSACWRTWLWSRREPLVWWPGRLLCIWPSGLWTTSRPSLAGRFWSWAAAWGWPVSPSVAPAVPTDLSSAIATPAFYRNSEPTSSWTGWASRRLPRSEWRSWTGRRWRRSSYNRSEQTPLSLQVRVVSVWRWIWVMHIQNKQIPDVNSAFQMWCMTLTLWEVWWSCCPRSWGVPQLPRSSSAPP